MKLNYNNKNVFNHIITSKLYMHIHHYDVYEVKYKTMVIRRF